MFSNLKKFQGYVDNEKDLMQTPPVDNWMIEREDFPLFEINFRRRGKLNEKALGGIFHFMTVPQLSRTGLERKYPDEMKCVRGHVSLGLRFIHCAKFSVKCLELVQESLNNSIRLKDRDYSIHLLDFSNNALDEAQLAVL